MSGRAVLLLAWTLTIPCRAGAAPADAWELDGATWHARIGVRIDDAGLGALVARSHRERVTHLAVGGYNQISTAGWRRLGALSDLVWLDLGGSSFPASELDVIAGLPRLAVLRLWHMDIRAADLRPLGRTTTLRTLDLTGAKLTDEPIPEMLSLRELNVSETEVRGQMLASLASKVPNLETLYLSGTHVRGPELASLQGLLHLQSLVLEYVKIGNRDLRYLSEVRSLRHLDVSRTRVVGTKSRFLSGVRIGNWDLKE